MKIDSYLNILLLGSLSLISLLTKPSFQTSNFSLKPKNTRFFNAFIALQAWKNAITDDPRGFTSNWNGPEVCNYTGIYCAPAPDKPHITTVAGIDLNHALISGYLPEELGLLTDLALIHLNTNRFKGTLPDSFQKLHLLYELDISNNLFYGEFPHVLLCLPSLNFLDIRFNKFHGKVPLNLFDLKLDALFINNNNFQFTLPTDFRNSFASVIVLANNNLEGCLDSSIGKLANTLNEIILMNSGLRGCLPDEIGLLTKLTVFDISSNNFVGNLPESMENMKSLEQLNVTNNELSGNIAESICSLPRLENFTYVDNYFSGEPSECLKLKNEDDTDNCIHYRPKQCSDKKCRSFYSHPVDCSASGCVTPPLHYSPPLELSPSPSLTTLPSPSPTHLSSPSTPHSPLASQSAVTSHYEVNKRFSISLALPIFIFFFY